MEPDIENMTINEYLEYEAAKERRLWDDVRSKRSPTNFNEADVDSFHWNKRDENMNQVGHDIVQDSIWEQDDDSEEDQEEDGDDRDTFDMWDITVEDVERIRKFFNVPDEIDEIVQPLIPEPIHTTPPNDDYVAPATKSILDKLLEEFRDEILNVTMDDEEANFNPNKDLKVLERLLVEEPQSYFTEIQLVFYISNLVLLGLTSILDEIDEIVQPLIPEPIHTTPPNDDYVAPTTKSILDELLEEFGDEILNVTMDDEEEANFNPTKYLEELERLLAKETQSNFTKIQVVRDILSRESHTGWWMLLEEADLEHGLEHVVSSYFRANPGESSILILLLFLNFHFLNCKMQTWTKTPLPHYSGRGFLANANAIIDYRNAKIAVGEIVTRSIFRVKEIDLGDEDVPY
ncbi:hypothetical protein Tco_0914254 [Tanacetum coccineum]